MHSQPTSLTAPPASPENLPLSAPSPIKSADDVAVAYLAGFKKATRDAYTRDLRRWSAHLTSVGVAPLDAHRVHVDSFVREIEAHGSSPATIARRLSALAGYYDYALSEGLIARSPIARVRRPRTTDVSPRLGLDRDQVAKLLDCADSSGRRDHALVCLLALSGLRISEALGADVQDLAHQRGHRTIKLRRKGGKSQTVALAPRTAAAVDDLCAGRVSGPLFMTQGGGRLDRQAAWKTIRRLAREAGTNTPLSPHSLRHSFVTLSLDAGVSLRDVQDAAGHADPRTTRRYDRGRNSLDRAATYALAAYVAAR